MEICKRIKKIRKDNNLTQEAFADIINVSRSTIALYEKGIRIPDINIIHTICDYFKISLDVIYEDFINQRNKDKNKFKGLILTIFTSLILIIFLLISYFTNIVDRYGYNIYDDTLKVQNCSDICIVKINYLEETSNNERIYNVQYIKNIIKDDYKMDTLIIGNKSIDINIDVYIVFGTIVENNTKINSSLIKCSMTIMDKPFIVELKDYNESLPFNEQTGKSKVIIDYYLDIINK